MKPRHAIRITKTRKGEPRLVIVARNGLTIIGTTESYKRAGDMERAVRNVLLSAQDLIAQLDEIRAARLAARRRPATTQEK